MYDRMKRHEILVLRRAGLTLREVARKAGVGVRTAQRILQLRRKHSAWGALRIHPVLRRRGVRVGWVTLHRVLKHHGVMIQTIKKRSCSSGSSAATSIPSGRWAFTSSESAGALGTSTSAPSSTFGPGTS